MTLEAPTFTDWKYDRKATVLKLIIKVTAISFVPSLYLLKRMDWALRISTMLCGSGPWTFRESFEHRNSYALFTFSKMSYKQAQEKWTILLIYQHQRTGSWSSTKTRWILTTVSRNGYQLSVQSNSRLLCFFFSTLCDWLTKLATLSQLMRSRTKANRVHVFPRLAPVTCIYFQFWLVHCAAYVSCN